jgi:hypothetical protein
MPKFLTKAIFECFHPYVGFVVLRVATKIVTKEWKSNNAVSYVS